MIQLILIIYLSISISKIAKEKETEIEKRRNQRRKVATVEFYLDLQRVPKGKGASAVKIINSSDWRVGYE
mgnify:CR=1 FL=1